MREEPQRIDGRLEGTLRIPDVDPSAIVVIAHPLPTHGGTMRNPFIAQIARSVADRGWYALRFNFRGTGDSPGEFTGGREEVQDITDAVAHARALAPGLPVGLVGYSFGALMTLRYLAAGGRADGVALITVPLRDPQQRPREVPPVPPGTFIVAADADQFGDAAELRAAFPSARIVEITGVDHFFVGKRDAAAALVTEELARSFAVPSHSP
jgi:alpha/beta superfamily hydrolase